MPTTYLGKMENGLLIAGVAIRLAHCVILFAPPLRTVRQVFLQNENDAIINNIRRILIVLVFFYISRLQNTENTRTTSSARKYQCRQSGGRYYS